MTQKFQFFVPGIARPGGSKKAFALGPKGREKRRPDGSLIINVVDACDNADWKRAASFTAAKAFTDPLLTGPLQLEVRFIMPRIGSHFGTGRNAELLKPSAPRFHIVMPDATKLLRALEDSLTGVIWEDDAQIVRQYVEKAYGEKPGAWITVSTIEEKPLDQERPEIEMPLFQITEV